MSDWHWPLSVHGEPNGNFGASGGVSMPLVASAIALASMAPQFAVAGSHCSLRLELAHAVANTSPTTRTRPIIEATLTREADRS